MKKYTVKKYAALYSCALFAVLASTPPIHCARAAVLPLDADLAVTALFSSARYETFGGLLLDENTLYTGNFTAVRAYDLISGVLSPYASIPANADTKALGKSGGNIYLAMDTSYWAPNPSNLGIVSATGFVPALISSTTGLSYSIYDAAVYRETYYFSANLAVNGTLTGSKIFRFDPDNPEHPVIIADIGGLSGGLAFDSIGNLYYASQNAGEGILRFAAADVANGGLSAADGVTVADITAGNIGFLATGELIASILGANLDGGILSAYDMAGGGWLYDIAATRGYEYMGKFVIGDDDTLYLISTDYGYSSPSLSTVYALKQDNPGSSPVPEPTSGLLFFSGLSIFLCWRNRCRSQAPDFLP